MIEAYLLTFPSSSFTLRHLGGKLADFIQSWEGLEGLKQRWFTAIARLEYAHMASYEAAEWPRVAPEKLAVAELVLQPHVVLLDLPVQADECATWEEFTPDEELPVCLAVWRGPSGSTVHCRLDPVEYELLARLRQGGTLASLFNEPTEREPLPDEVARWFADWQSRGWIAMEPAAAESGAFAVVGHRADGDVDWSRIDKMGSQARAMED